LHPEFSAPLKQFAQRVGLQPNMLIRVDGHTSTSGSEKGNQRLSQARSDAVRQFLIDAGVSASRIEAKGHGETSPLERERKRNGQLIPRSMARNRRVEVRQHAQAAISTPSKAELEATIRRTGPPPAHRPEWIMWVYNNVLSPFGTAQTVAEWTARFSKIDIEARLDMASLIETVAWIFFSTAASYSEGQAIGYANGAKRGFASALVAMSKSVTDPPTGKIVFPSDEPPLDIKAIPYNEGAQDGYRKGVQTAIQLIGNLQNESPHGGEIFLLGLRYVYGNKMYRSMVDLLGGEERRFPTPIPWWLRLLSGESK